MNKNDQTELEIAPKLTKESKELEEREKRIERLMKGAWHETGLDLAAIRDGDLYKAARPEPIAGRYTFTTWDEYVQARWEMTDSRADAIIQSAQAVEGLKNHLNSGQFLPQRESHVRELLKLETDDRPAVWQKVVEEYGQQATARDVAAVVAKYKTALEKKWTTLTEWNAITNDDGRLAVLDAGRGKSVLNKQENESIEWAQWSWNPVTGCKHDCPYCYARDIAQRFYPQGFEPTIHPDRLSAPSNTEVPDSAKSNTAFKNIFTCSMADLFGKWVPTEWIEAVLDVARKNKQWNFLFLTKFPRRLAEFSIPKNAWVGTTVDIQARVKYAEAAFEALECGVKWLSVEPMLEPLKFKRLELFQWVVIGGASESTKTPAWAPPMQWMVDLHGAARDAGCRIYYKANAFSGKAEYRQREFPWENKSEHVLPKELDYAPKS